MCSWRLISTILSKREYFSRSQTVTYTANMVKSRKRCKIETLLLQSSSKK